MQLIEIKTISGTLKAVTGLHIGGRDEGLSIGGVANTVIRNPITGEPYVPGSSLKGKMRSLTEWQLGGNYLVDGENAIHDCNEVNCKVCRVFGAPAKEPEEGVIRGPTRLIVRDAFLTEASRQRLLEMNLEQGTNFAEIKQEVFIPRLRGRPNPRTMERVPAGTSFDFRISYKVFDIDDGGEVDQRYFEEVVVNALTLLEDDALGGSVSRGYGEVELDYEVT